MLTWIVLGLALCAFCLLVVWVLYDDEDESDN